MPAYLYKKFKINGNDFYSQIKKIPLAGFNAIFNLWEKKGKPLNRGWRIAKEELIAYALGNEEELNMYSVIIDVTPSRKTEVNLLELLDIYVYTYGDKKGEKAQWSNLMLRTREIFGGLLNLNRIRQN